MELLHNTNPKQKQSNEPDVRRNDPTLSPTLTDSPMPVYDDVSGASSSSPDTNPEQKHGDSSAELQAGNNEDGIISVEEFDGPPILDDKGDYEEIDTDATRAQQNSWLVLQKPTEGKPTEPHTVKGDVIACVCVQSSLLFQFSFANSITLNLSVPPHYLNDFSFLPFLCNIGPQ